MMPDYLYLNELAIVKKSLHVLTNHVSIEQPSIECQVLVTIYCYMTIYRLLLSNA